MYGLISGSYMVWVAGIPLGKALGGFISRSDSDFTQIPIQVDTIWFKLGIFVVYLVLF